MTPNSKPGACIDCRAIVPTGEGRRIVRMGRFVLVICRKCDSVANPSKETDNA